MLFKKFLGAFFATTLLVSTSQNAFCKAAPVAASKTATKAPQKKLFMWKVTSPKSKDSIVYLIGSIHMVRPDFYPLPKPMEEQFKNASTLVLEIDESKDDQSVMQKYAMEAGVYTGGDTIENHISAKTNEELQKYCATIDKMMAMSFVRMKPWFVSVELPVLELQKLGFDPKLGVDKHFLEEAHEQGKRVEELETAKFQLDLLSGFSEDLQDKLLLSSLLDAQRTEEDARDMVNAWKAGNDSLMNEVITRDEKEHPELEPIMQKLMYERNDDMSNKIEKYLSSGKTYFVCVGAGHVVGPKGIVQQLKDKGFKVEQVTGN